MARDVEISQAASSGDIERVRKILNEKGTLLNKRSKNMRALTNASANGHLKIVKLLLDSGININSEEDYPLSMACVYNRLEIVRFFLNETTITYCPGRLLRIAALAGHIELLTELIRYGVDVNSTECLVVNGENIYDSALLAACRVGRLDVVNLLLTQKGIHVNQQLSDQGFTPLMLACQNGHLAIVDRLLNHPLTNINLVTWEGENALAIACNKEYEDIVDSLLRHDANPNQINSDGRTIIMQSLFLGTDRITKKLMTSSLVNYDAVDFLGCSVKQYAIIFQKEHLIKQALPNSHHVTYNYNPRFYSVLPDAVPQPDERVSSCTIV